MSKKDTTRAAASRFTYYDRQWRPDHPCTATVKVVRTVDNPDDPYKTTVTAGAVRRDPRNKEES